MQRKIKPVCLNSRAIRKILEEEPKLTMAEFKRRIGYKKDKK